MVQLIKVSGGGGGGGDAYTKAESDAKFETITSHDGDIADLNASISTKADISALDALNTVVVANTSSIDDLEVSVAQNTTDISNTYTKTEADTTFATITSLDDTNGDVGLLDSRVSVLETQKSILKASNTTATLVLTTTPTLVNLPTTTLTVGTNITKTSNTLFTINKTGYYNLLTRLRGTQTGAGTDTICNIDVLKNGVIIQTIGITMVDVAINTYNFVELALALNATDTLSFNVYFTGGGGITLSTATINPLASLTIQEA